MKNEGGSSKAYLMTAAYYRSVLPTSATNNLPYPVHGRPVVGAQQRSQLNTHALNTDYEV